MNIRNHHINKAILVLLVFLAGCRGQTSSKPPILPIRNMVDQSSYGPQSPNQHYADKRSYRSPVQDTISFGNAHTNSELYKGQKKGASKQTPQWATSFPLRLDKKLLMQGQKQFNVYCTPCHGVSGHNDGLVTKKANGPIKPADLFDAQRLALPAGKIFSEVSEGVNNWNMPGYAQQLSVKDRWAVVAYVRALQLSQNSPVPSQTKSKN